MQGFLESDCVAEPVPPICAGSSGARYAASATAGRGLELARHRQRAYVSLLTHSKPR